MSKRTQYDDMVDEAIEELIDNNTSGFHLITSKRKNGGVKWDQTFYEDPIEVEISDDVKTNSNNYQLYFMAKLMLDRLRETHGDEITMEDVCMNILTIHEEIETTNVNVYEYNSIEE